MHNYLSILGFRTTLILAIGKLLNLLLKSINYYSIHLPLKNEVLECKSMGLNVYARKNHICIKHFAQTYLLRPGTSDFKVFKQVILEKEYLTLIKIISDLKAENSINSIIDAGANIGLTSLFFRQHYPLSKILTIEPDQSNYFQQIKNLEVNNSKDFVIPINKALWHNNIDNLIISNNFRDGDAWSKSVIIGKNKDDEIPSITLLDLSNQYFPNSFIDILKIDIEGAEGVLFENEVFIKTLSSKVRFLSLEIHDECVNRTALMDKLGKLNFRTINVGETTFCINKSLIKS